MKCIVTGVAGFVGSSLAEQLLEDGHQVVGIDCFVDYYPRQVKEQNLRVARSKRNFTFFEEDLRSADLKRLFDSAEVIFHQAGQAGVRASWGQLFESYIGHNIYVTQRLLEHCREIDTLKAFVFASSSSIYGNAESFPTTERAIPLPVSPYGVTKLAAEHLVTLYGTQFGLPTVSLRYFTVYGPRQRPDMAFTRFISAALKGQELKVFGDGEQSRNFTFIADIVRANKIAAEWINNNRSRAGAVFNIGGGSQVTVNQILEQLEKLLGPLQIHKQARQVGDALHTSADTTLAQRDLGFTPQVTLFDGLERQVAWLKETAVSSI